MSEFYLTDNQAYAFDKHKRCPICHCHYINDIFDEYMIKDAKTIQSYAKCPKCLTDFTIYYKRKYVTYHIKEKPGCQQESVKDPISFQKAMLKKEKKQLKTEQTISDGKKENQSQECLTMEDQQLPEAKEHNPEEPATNPDTETQK